jgi:hypothetical protein
MGNNIKMNLTEVGWQHADWIDLAHHGSKWKAVVTRAVRIRGPKWAMNF